MAGENATAGGRMVRSRRVGARRPLHYDARRVGSRPARSPCPRRSRPPLARGHAAHRVGPRQPAPAGDPRLPGGHGTRLPALLPRPGGDVHGVQDARVDVDGRGADRRVSRLRAPARGAPDRPEPALVRRGARRRRGAHRARGGLRQGAARRGAEPHLRRHGGRLRGRSRGGRAAARRDVRGRERRGAAVRRPRVRHGRVHAHAGARPRLPGGGGGAAARGGAQARGDGADAAALPLHVRLPRPLLPLPALAAGGDDGAQAPLPLRGRRRASAVHGAPPRPRRGVPRGVLIALAAAAPTLVTVVLLYVHLGAHVRDFVPSFWNDQVGYWHRAASFSRVGLDSGYYAPNEHTAAWALNRFGVGGPWYPALYGAIGSLVGWEL